LAISFEIQDLRFVIAETGNNLTEFGHQANDEILIWIQAVSYDSLSVRRTTTPQKHRSSADHLSADFPAERVTMQWPFRGS
jgi:hypothetical protein